MTPAPPSGGRLRGVAVPALDPGALYDITTENGVFTAFTATGPRQGGEHELWPGYTETHAHVALPANWDDTVEDPRIVALQYLYHGVTHVVDMFGFPLAADAWAAGREASPWPYPEIVHCGYAVTATTDTAGRTGHGVEFPAPVHMLSVESDLDHALRANAERGGTFLKVMFTDGTEQPGSPVRFSRLSERVLRFTARMAAERGVTAVIDCNTLQETCWAYACGFRLFAHTVRDRTLDAIDWKEFEGARFVSTLAGLRPMIMTGEEFLTEYAREGFAETQDVRNLDFVRGIEKPYGIEYGVQETRTAALADMRRNALAALSRGDLLIGTDSGNTGAYHGYSLLGELDLLRGDDPSLDRMLRHGATVGGRRYFDELSGGPAGEHPLSAGAPATYNLLPAATPDRPLSALPVSTVVRGTDLDRPALARAIADLRAPRTPSDPKGTTA
ncbi:amidohydrolase family protein [Streptomyces griseiscabiei]|uniref:Hydrolase n=1 Tax=Streptomyces griseiscabiei TaxID=2993540 RepID=A0ABU4KZS6_9ACTN|nr:hydrolase [Streptomyces griseiscabiei]MBZ3900908.1 hydrolase [Streptomyces griseiscabiei]MDX2908962.1 hydrolase [Streptomyces griseiscabiei]